MTEVNPLKRVLVVHYSQTGQLDRVVESIIQPLVECDQIQVTDLRIEPVVPFPFPWPFIRFINSFPESVHQVSCELKPLSIDLSEQYDLVILAYQVWFLAPSIPISSFLQSESARELLRDTPVMTVIACRDMWMMAQEKVKQHLQRLQACLVGNVVLVDAAGSAASFLSTPLWVLTGKKGPFPLGIPAAGVAEDEIRSAGRFGIAVRNRLLSKQRLDATVLQGTGAVRINDRLIPSEKIATRSFYLWGKLFLALGGPDALLRKPLAIIYALFLIAMIITVVPITALLKRIFAPLLKERIKQQRMYYAEPSGEAWNIDQPGV